MAKTTKRTAKAATAHKNGRKAHKPRETKPAETEPEVLGNETHDGHREPLLDPVEDLLCGAKDHTMAARLLIQEAFGGKCDAAREAEVLKMVKGDARFRIIAGHGGAPNRIALASAVDEVVVEGKPLDLSSAPKVSGPVDAGEGVEMQPDANGVVSGTVDNTDAPAQRTLGDLVKEYEGRPLRIPWPHDVGSSVLLLTDGYPPSKAQIKNMRTVGNATFYDLIMPNGGETNEVPAYRIGRDLDAEGELEAMRLRMAALERHIAKGATLAQRIVVKQGEERMQAEALSKLRKEIEALHDELADHERSDPGQTDLRDVVGEDDGEGHPEYPATDGDAPATVAKRLEAGDVIDLDACPFDADGLAAARFDRATASTGKPQRVAPVAYQDADYVLADVQRGVAVLLPVVDAKRWRARFLDRFGEVLELPSDVQSARLEAGGKLCGMPVKIGRATRWIGPEADALLLALPPELHGVAAAAAAEPALSGKDAAAGG